MSLQNLWDHIKIYLDTSTYFNKCSPYMTKPHAQMHGKECAFKVSLGSRRLKTEEKYYMKEIYT
jgi:hypothetical protein